MIRALETADIPALYEMMQEFAIFDGDAFEADLGDFRQFFHPDQQHIYTLVAVAENGALVGFLNYYFTVSSFELARTIWVEDAFVREEYRGSGYGYALFQAVSDIATNESADRIEWLVRRENLSGQAFYERIGAEVKKDTIYVKWKLTNI